jgi:tRNA(Ile)-lysidine synthetase-like protein
MEKVIVSFFEKNNLILKGKTLAVAVSTGIDSMALLVALCNLKVDYGLNIHILHVNHGMREESIKEEEYIKDYASKNGLEIHIMHLEKNEEENFQSYARDQRYKFFFNVMKKIKGDYLLLAHHANDNMETIMMRMLRGSNLRGYAGISDVIDIQGFKIVRPFLNILKDDLIEYINLHKIKYYEDCSNESSVYTRNRIRKELIPILFTEEKNAHIKFLEFSNTLKEAAEIVEEKVKSIITSFDKGKDYISFSRTKFLLESSFIQEEILFFILKKYELSKANILEIIKLINSKKQNLKVEFKGEFTFVREYDKITFFDYLIKPLDVYIVIDEIKTYNINDTIEVNVSKTDSNFIPSKMDLWYNSDILPVIIRSRKPGDKILLEGGYKKVKDLLIDLKVGILERDNVLVLEKDQKILSVIGIRKSVELKQIKNNDIIIKVRLKQNG